MRGPGKRAVFAIDERPNFFEQKFCVTIGAPAAESGHMGRSVFANARSRVVHADDDERFNLPRTDAKIRRLPHVPVLPWKERRGPIEKILPVMKIEDGKWREGCSAYPGGV